MPKLKLRPSLKSLQEAMTCLNPVGPICIQESQTHSFREVIVGEISSSALSKPSKRTNQQNPIDDHLPTPPELDKGSLSAPNGRMSSRRFFFSPHTTKSIMEEAEADDEAAAVGRSSDFWKESMATVMASEEPYRDFRTSMEEMVEGHGVRGWSELQELLHCYLRLNDKGTHNIIRLAFVDMIMCLVARDNDDS